MTGDTFQTESITSVEILAIATSDQPPLPALSRQRFMRVQLEQQDEPVDVDLPAELGHLLPSDPRVKSYILSWIMARRYKPDSFRANAGSDAVDQRIKLVGYRDS